jgi:hypothetical protein
MPVEVKLRGDQPQTMAARVAKRLQPSNDKSTADEGVCVGTGPTRTHTTIHKSGQQAQSKRLGNPSAQMKKEGYER